MSIQPMSSARDALHCNPVAVLNFMALVYYPQVNPIQTHPQDAELHSHDVSVEIVVFWQVAKHNCNRIIGYEFPLSLLVSPINLMAQNIISP